MVARDLHALVIAIDGPSGSGKSTVARGVARALGLRYLDTGAMYRALTWLALQRRLDLLDANALGGLAAAARLQVTTDPDRQAVTADGAVVTREIRGDDVTKAVSAVSAVPAVRSELVRRQRQLIGAGGIVVEGRDIGTTVSPDARVKVFLTAQPAERAMRRARELLTVVDDRRLATTDEALRRRDALDSGRSASPLAQAPDALVIDSTALSADEVVARVLAHVETVTRQ